MPLKMERPTEYGETRSTAVGLAVKVHRIPVIKSGSRDGPTIVQKVCDSQVPSRCVSNAIIVLCTLL